MGPSPVQPLQGAPAPPPGPGSGLRAGGFTKGAFLRKPLWSGFRNTVAYGFMGLGGVRELRKIGGVRSAWTRLSPGRRPDEKLRTCISWTAVRPVFWDLGALRLGLGQVPRPVIYTTTSPHTWMWVTTGDLTCIGTSSLVGPERLTVLREANANFS